MLLLSVDVRFMCVFGPWANLTYFEYHSYRTYVQIFVELFLFLSDYGVEEPDNTKIEVGPKFIQQPQDTIYNKVFV